MHIPNYLIAFSDFFIAIGQKANNVITSQYILMHLLVIDFKNCFFARGRSKRFLCHDLNTLSDFGTQTHNAILLAFAQ